MSPRALFGGGKRRVSTGSAAAEKAKRELVLPPVEDENASDDENDAEMAESDERDEREDADDSADERANNGAMGLMVATHAVSSKRN